MSYIASINLILEVPSNLWGWAFLPCSPWVGGTATPSTFHLGQHRATAPLWWPSCQHGALGANQSRGQRWGHRSYRAGDETGNSRIEPLLGAFLQDKRGSFSVQRAQTASIFLYISLQYKLFISVSLFFGNVPQNFSTRDVDSQLGAMGIQGQLEVGGDRGSFGFSAIAHGRQSDCAT